MVFLREVCCPSNTKMFFLLLVLLGAAYGEDCKFFKFISQDMGSCEIRNIEYPGKYGPSSHCFWLYYTDRDSRLSLDCYSVELGNSVPWNCSDSLSLDGSLDDNKKFCSPFNVESSSTRMMLKLSSTPQSLGGKFACSIRAIKDEFCECGWSPPIKIVGGRETGINEFPSMVSIIDVRKRGHACGGTIISTKFVVTAAHCLLVLDVKMTGLLVGEHDMSTGAETNATKLYRAEAFIIHPAYDRSLNWNDIGLIKSATIAFSREVGPICLPFNRPHLPGADEFLTALGWGTTFFAGPRSDVLLKTSLKVVQETKCVAVFNQSAASGKQVCTFGNGKDTCQMDSGGPLISFDMRTALHFLAALVSFGPSDCGGSDPAVNTKITPYLDWIQRETGGKQFYDYCIK